MRFVKAALGAAVLAGLLFAGSVAFAAATPAGGAIRVFVTPGAGANSKIVITGAIGDYGKAVSTDKNGKTDVNGAFEKITLKKGSFVVDTTALNAKLNKLNPAINKTTCSFALSASAPSTLAKGTGLYAGISGKVEISVVFALVGPRLANGQCNPSMNAKPLAQFQSITATGTVSFT